MFDGNDDADSDDEGGFCRECGDDAMSGRDICRHCAREQGEFD